MNVQYVVGLVDGEGSFTVYIRKPNASQTVRRVKAEPKFYIKLIEKDKHILDELQKFFGCGRVYFQKDSRPNHQHCYRYEVFRRDDLETVIIPFFRKYSLQFVSKRRDFELFCELVEGIRQNEHLTAHGLQKLYAIKQKMH